jgi:hypothetical protein
MNPESGIVTVSSQHSADDTVLKLTELFRSKNVKLFTLVDFSGEASAVGLDVRPQSFSSLAVRMWHAADARFADGSA